MTEQVLCQVSKEAKDVLIDWQKANGLRQQGAALESLLLKFAERKCPNCGYQRLED